MFFSELRYTTKPADSDFLSGKSSSLMPFRMFPFWVPGPLRTLQLAFSSHLSLPTSAFPAFLLKEVPVSMVPLDINDYFQ